MNQTTTRSDCAFVAAWAETIRLATVHDLQTTELEQERAVRVLITLADDARLYPPHADSTSSVYLAVATFFASVHDYQSSVAALDVARFRLDDPGYSADQREEVLAAIDRLAKQVERLAAQEKR